MYNQSQPNDCLVYFFDLWPLHRVCCSTMCCSSTFFCWNPGSASKLPHVSIVEKHECVTILFSDIVTFTNMAAKCEPIEIVALLNDLFMRFDQLSNKHDVYKVGCWWISRINCQVISLFYEDSMSTLQFKILVTEIYIFNLFCFGVSLPCTLVTGMVLAAVVLVPVLFSCFPFTGVVSLVQSLCLIEVRSGSGFYFPIFSV